LSFFHFLSHFISGGKKKPNYNAIGLLLTTHQSKPSSKNPISSEDHVQRDNLQRETIATSERAREQNSRDRKTTHKARGNAL
jgi:hypothetical protein